MICFDLLDTVGHVFQGRLPIDIVARRRAAQPPPDGQRAQRQPREPPSDFAVTGIYFYDDRVFDVVSSLKPSSRGELEITDVNNAYIERGQLAYDVLTGYWTDAGTHESLRLANELVLGLPLSEPHLQLHAATHAIVSHA